MGENVYSLGEGSTGLLHGHLHEPLLWLINGPEGLDMKVYTNGKLSCVGSLDVLIWMRGVKGQYEIILHTAD